MGLRSLAPVLAVVPLLAVPAVASAQDGRCAAVEGVGFVWEPGVLDSVDPDELLSPDPDVEAPLAAMPVADALACASAADVRCQPLHESDAPTAPRIGTSGPEGIAGIPALAIEPDDGRDLSGFGETALLGAGRDPGSELLRPPRG